jgi:hypothetical protein
MEPNDIRCVALYCIAYEYSRAQCSAALKASSNRSSASLAPAVMAIRSRCIATKVGSGVVVGDHIG